MWPATLAVVFIAIILPGCTTSAGNGGLLEQRSQEGFVETFTPRHVFRAPRTQPFQLYGSALAISGEHAVVGAVGSRAAGESGSVHVVTFREPELPPVTFASEDASALFGSSVAVAGDTIVVGAPYDSRAEQRAGAVYVYRLHGSYWEQTAVLTAGRPARLANFGQVVALDGDTLAVGAPGAGTGTVHLFQPSAVGWLEVAVLSPSGDDEGARFGSELDLFGERLAVGAWTTSNEEPGRVYLFNRLKGIWHEEWYAESEVPSDGFGRRLALDDGLLAVSTLGGPGLPTVHTYVRANGGWSRSATILAPKQAAAGFGQALALDAGQLLVAAPTAHRGAPAAGLVRVYEFTEGEWMPIGILGPSSSMPDQEFGATVAVHGGTVVAGAPGAVEPNELLPSGAAYLFTLPLPIR